jgi:hypothetical protein
MPVKKNDKKSLNQVMDKQKEMDGAIAKWIKSEVKKDKDKVKKD